MSNIYHILWRTPVLTKKEMQPHIEDLAMALVKSGKIRIDTDFEINFVRFSIPRYRINIVFSHRELFDPDLSIHTRSVIANALRPYCKRGESLSDKVEQRLEKLQKLSGNNIDVNPEVEAKIARCLVQAVDPIVIQLAILEKTEIFISYSQTIGDMLDIGTWQQVGSSSGLQSTDGLQSKVLVSSGGNPFVKDINENKGFEYGDGYPSLARLMVIAAQELGHYADIKRKKNGTKFSRHSADIYGIKAKKNTQKARISDMKNIEQISGVLGKMGIADIIKLEKHIKFYQKQKRKLEAFKHKLRYRTIYKNFLVDLQNINMGFLTTLPASERPVTQIMVFLEDMQNNLEPKDDAYKRDTAEETEAIACVEALARVPQQVVKWGREAVKYSSPKLYKIYYGDVMASCEKFYESSLPFK